MIRDACEGDFEAIPMAPFRLEEMKSQLMAFRWRIYPRPQATAADKFITLFFKNRPILHAVFLQTGHFGLHFFSHFFITYRSPEKSHDAGVPPKASGQPKVIFFPGAEEQSVGAENFHQKTISPALEAGQFTRQAQTLQTPADVYSPFTKGGSQ